MRIGYSIEKQDRRGIRRAALTELLLRAAIPFQTQAQEENGALLRIDYGASNAGSGVTVQLPDSGALEDIRHWRSQTVELLDRVLRVRSPKELAGEVFRKAGDSLSADLDLPAIVFGLLNRWEERLEARRDVHGRFPSTASLLSKGTLLGRPVCDWIGQALGLALRESGQGRADMAAPAWNGRDWAFGLTFDVDSAGMYHRSAIAGNVRRVLSERGSAAAAGALLEGLIVQTGMLPDPHLNLSQIGDMLVAMRCPATFFVQVTRAHELDGYSLEDHPQLVRQIRRLRLRGHEIGLHGSYRSTDEDPGFLEKQRLTLCSLAGGPVDSQRFHYLRTTGESDMAKIEAAGHAIDSSLGFSDHEGFRVGTCHPFRPWNEERNESLPLLEIPLHVMDVTLRYHREMDPYEAYDVMEAYMDRVREARGVAVFLSHPHNLERRLWKGWEQFPYRVVRIAGQKDGRMDTIQNIAGMHLRRREALCSAGMVDLDRPND